MRKHANSSKSNGSTNAYKNSKRYRAHDKLDYNLKRMLDHLPQELKDMKI